MPQSSKKKKNSVLEWELSRIYPFYIEKAEKKDRTQAEVDQIIHWLFGYDDTTLKAALQNGTTFEAFLTTAAPKHNQNRKLITGVVCGVRVEEIEDKTVREMRYLDKLIDELARGKSMDKILRKPAA